NARRTTTRLRRCRGGRRDADRKGLHRSRSPRGHGWFQRRALGRRARDATSRTFSRGGLLGAPPPHGFLSPILDREALAPRIWVERRSRAVPMALRLLAVSPCSRRSTLSRGALYDCRER